MKVVFVGPTVPDAGALYPDITILPPARQGDLLRSVLAGANVIGLVDGYFEYVPSVWHKEILYALSKGCQVLGAASMGALRAAECAPFGMIPVGTIAHEYLDGARVDDSDVAQSHAPAELNYLPLSQPQVNIEATLSHLFKSGEMTESEHGTILEANSRLFFKDRTWKAIFHLARLPDEKRALELLQLITKRAINQKRRDACILMENVSAMTDARQAPPENWAFETTVSFRNTIQFQTE